MGYIILSVTGFSEVGEKQEYFITLLQLFFVLLFLKIKLVKKAFYVVMSKMKLILFIAYNHLCVLFYL